MWQEIWEHEGARAARDWCQDHFLLFDTLTKIRDTRLQLARVRPFVLARLRSTWRSETLLCTAPLEAESPLAGLLAA